MPKVVIICSGGLRCMDMIRLLKHIHEKSRIAKLFSKHLKLEDQLKYLKQHPKTNIVCGTPNRLYKLESIAAIAWNEVKLIVLDCGWKDAKDRSLLDLPEMRKDVLNLLSGEVLDRLKSSNTKIAVV